MYIKPYYSNKYRKAILMDKTVFFKYDLINNMHYILISGMKHSSVTQSQTKFMYSKILKYEA